MNGSDDAAGAGTGADAGRFIPVAGSPVPGDGRSITVEGATVTAPDGERFSTMLRVDLDGHGATRDLVATRLRADGTAWTGIGVYRRAGNGFTAVSVADAGPTDPGCTETRLQWTSPRSVVVAVRCAPGPRGDGGVASPFLEEQTLIGLADPPLVRYRAALSTPLPGESLTLTLEGTDRDGDGRDDVVAHLAAGSPRSTPHAEAQVVLLDRAGGIARDVTEPGASLTALVSAARRNLTGRRAAVVGAVTAMEDLGRLRRALCSDTGTTRLRLGTATGVDCAAVQGVFAQGAEVLARGRVALGDLPAAWVDTRVESAGDLGVAAGTRLQTDLEHAAVPVRGVGSFQGQAVAQPLDALVPARTGVLVLDPPAAPMALSLRGPVTARMELATLSFAPGPPGTLRDVMVHSPDGAHTVVGFADTCEGIGAVVCATAAGGCDQPLLPGATALPPGATLARFSTLPSRATAVRCVNQPGAVVVIPAAEGVRALGWGRNGPVFLWQGRLFRGADADTVSVPVTESLGPGFAPGGAISPGGSAAVVNGPEGIWVRSQRAWHLWTPAALAGRYAQLTDLTVSEDGRTVAGLLGATVWVVERHDP